MKQTKPPTKPKPRQFEVQCIRGRYIVHSFTVQASSFGEAEKISKPERERIGCRRHRYADLSQRTTNLKHGGWHQRSIDWRTYGQ